MRPVLRYGNCLSIAHALIGVLLFSGWPLCAVAADDSTAALERRVKAAFLFQFLNYIEWPEGAFPQANAPVTLAVAGDDELGAELAQIVATRTVNRRPVLVRKPKLAEALGEVHLLFVGRAEIANLPQWKKLAQSRPILIITEVAGALNQGSMINFQLIENRLRFEIALDELDKHRLKVSSRLLAVAHTVRKPSPQ